MLREKEKSERQVEAERQKRWLLLEQKGETDPENSRKASQGLNFSRQTKGDIELSLRAIKDLDACPDEWIETALRTKRYRGKPDLEK